METKTSHIIAVGKGYLAEGDRLTIYIENAKRFDTEQYLNAKVEEFGGRVIVETTTYQYLEEE
ncbi:hypothetical protein HCA69_12370 [Listeria grandensis]|uniref:Uncharacterized protein n=1 Tax=Listeria grandensis TaxID=1494963 RepID=A0A7X0Y528_9LIST|nr:hypothetical protein [Listeria grandensis]MBC1937167.1 hypothetical protein [Listeria grandensis]